MAKHTKNGENKNGSWKGFVDCTLSEQQRRLVNEWDCNGLSEYELLTTLVESGYKVSLSFNAGNEAFLLALTGTPEAGKNAGYTMTSHAKDLGAVLKVAAAKHFLIMNEDWSTAKFRAADEEWG